MGAITKRAIIPDAVFENEEDDALEIYDGVVLTEDEVLFVDYYIGEARFSASKAYRMLRSKSNDWNRIGPKWVRKPHIAKAIKARLDAANLSAEAALNELNKVALADFSEFLDVKTRDGEVISVRFDPSAKVRALELILRAHNRLDNSAAVAIPIQININTPGLKEDELA